MKVFLAAMTAVLFLGTAAQARGHHHHHKTYQAYQSYQYHHKHFATKSRIHFRQLNPKPPAQSSGESASSQMRPRDCYGIPWCGCWLRHQFGLADTSLNLAASWLRYTPATPQTANIIVWPNRHHVGKVLQAEGNRVLVISGNAGRNSGRPVWITYKGFYLRKV